MLSAALPPLLSSAPWPTLRLSAVAEVVNGSGFSEALQGRTDLPHPFVKVSDMNAPGAEVFVRTAANTVDEAILKILGAKLHPTGTIIFPKVGGALLTNKKRILGKPAAFDNNVMGVVPTAVETEWLYYWFLTVDLRTLANTQALPSIRQSDIAALQLPVPPKEERLRITNCLREQLTQVEWARTAVDAQMKAADALPAAFLRGVFANSTAHQWPMCKLGDAAEIVGGLQKTPHRNPQAFHKAFLTVRNVQHGYLDLRDVQRFEVTPAEFERVRLEKGDLLLVEGNGSKDHIGRNALFYEDGDWIHQNHIIRVRLDRRAFVPEFVGRYLNSDAGRVQLLKKAETTTGLYTLSTGKVARCSFRSQALRINGGLPNRWKRSSRTLSVCGDVWSNSSPP